MDKIVLIAIIIFILSSYHIFLEKKKSKIYEFIRII